MLSKRKRKPAIECQSACPSNLDSVMDLESCPVIESTGSKAADITPALLVLEQRPRAQRASC